MYFLERKNKCILYDDNGKIIIITSHKPIVRNMMKDYGNVKSKQPVFKPSDTDSSEI